MTNDITSAFDKINYAKQELLLIISNITNLDKEKATTLIKRQLVAFEGNFVVWLSSILLTAKALKTIEVTRENLTEELEWNHAGLLRDFAKSWNALPSIEDYNFLENEITTIRELVSEMSWLKNLVLLTLLEITAPDCMSVFQNAANLIWANDSRYTSLHYELDKKHSQEFLDSLIEEIKFYDSPLDLIDDSIEKSLNLLKKIWAI